MKLNPRIKDEFISVCVETIVGIVILYGIFYITDISIKDFLVIYALLAIWENFKYTCTFFSLQALLKEAERQEKESEENKENV